MNKLYSLALAAVLMMSFGTQASEHQHHNSSHAQHAEHAATAASYACPMHPEVTGHAGDDCNKCGMKLEATKADGQRCPHGESCNNCPNQGKMKHQHMGVDTHACPMNPKITGKAGDTCPKCGMNLEPIAATHACPMHSKVTGNADDECPKCGMKLEQKHAHQH
ncbi:heavy metal-binding domain-containing protein [Ferrimonas lipolytica]|uniref:Heavy metal binding domain-containing protein n=1 Tax=Ferrimonas lipolytica TaxID=2724191 RepID=A0A6H1UID7_9GAMM|nr:heavy metal-binding domain-containing protein [Ferrimonas lipolytica]QIZ78370.1 hypothetical protein HER31_16560 [Ferrimonas lipolytica]